MHAFRFIIMPCLHEATVAAIVAAMGRGDDSRNQTGDRSSNSFADPRCYANYINQK